MPLPPNAILTQISPPSLPSPLDLDAAKAYLRIEQDDEDDLIRDMIAAATEVAAQKTGRSLGVTSWELRLDYLPGGWGAFGQGCPASIELPRPPLIAVDSITYDDQNGTIRTLDPSTYVVIPGSPGRLAPAYGTFFPFSRPQVGSVAIRYRAGSVDTPRSVIQAIHLITAHLYEHRSDDAPIPAAVDALLSVHTWFAYS